MKRITLELVRGKGKPCEGCCIEDNPIGECPTFPGVDSCDAEYVWQVAAVEEDTKELLNLTRALLKGAAQMRVKYNMTNPFLSIVRDNAELIHKYKLFKES